MTRAAAAGILRAEARVAELVDAVDLKSTSPVGEREFESRPGHSRRGDERSESRSRNAGVFQLMAPMGRRHPGDPGPMAGHPEPSRA